jgi:arsenate reductase (thioredoxin)
MPNAKPAVLFLCTHNAGRSQMALGYFNHLAGDQGIDAVRTIRDDVEHRVRQLLVELGIDPVA